MHVWRLLSLHSNTRSLDFRSSPVQLCATSTHQDFQRFFFSQSVRAFARNASRRLKCAIFCRRHVECVSIQCEKLACQKLLLWRTYSLLPGHCFFGWNRMGMGYTSALQFFMDGSGVVSCHVCENKCWNNKLCVPSDTGSPVSSRKPREEKNCPYYATPPLAASLLLGPAPSWTCRQKALTSCLALTAAAPLARPPSATVETGTQSRR